MTTKYKIKNNVTKRMTNCPTCNDELEPYEYKNDLYYICHICKNAWKLDIEW